LIDDLAVAVADPLSVDEVNYWYFPTLKLLSKTTIQVRLPTRRAPQWRQAALSPHPHPKASPSKALARQVPCLVRVMSDKPTDRSPARWPWQRSLLPSQVKEFDLGRLTSSLYGGFAKGKPMEGHLTDFTTVFLTSPDPLVAGAYSLAYHNLLHTFPATLPLSQALPSQPPLTLSFLQTILKTYDQYEFAIPLPLAATCVQGLFDLMARDDQLRGNFRVPILIRYVEEEPGLLSLTRGGPRLFINMDNYEYYSKGAHTHPPSSG
jgi:hypothetical protein